MKAKTKLLKSKECFENDFSEAYLSNQSSDSGGDSFPSSEDDDVSSIEDSDKDESSDTLEVIHKVDVLAQPSPLLEMKNGLTLDMIIENELAITRSSSAQISPTSPKVFLENDDNLKEVTQPTSILTLLHDFEQPIEIVKENIDVANNLSSQLVDRLLDEELFDYFTKSPGRFRKLRDRNNRNKRLVTDIKKNKIPVKRANNYKGVCRLVTVLNHRRGSYFDNSSSTRLFDTSGNEWRKQDLPNFIGINTTKYTECNQTYRQRKKDIDYFMTNSKPKKIMKYKSDAADVECLETAMIQSNSKFMPSVKEPSEIITLVDVKEESVKEDHSHCGKIASSSEKNLNIQPTLIPVNVVKAGEKKKSEVGKS